MLSEKMKSMKIVYKMICIIAVIVVIFSANAFAQSQFGIRERAEKREGSRWTLAEWLEQRDRNRLMDVWLSLNSPSPYEFMIGGSFFSYKLKTDSATVENQNSFYAGELQAYAQFVGLAAEYSNNPVEKLTDTTGMLNLRLLGSSLQNSSLTLSFGQRTRLFLAGSNEVSHRNLFTQLRMQIHFSKFFGVDSFYRRYEPALNSVLSQSIGGDLAQAGLFIDFKAVRLYGAWQRDQQKSSSSVVDTTSIRDGIVTGVKIFY
jgi:hypothetical protein